MAFLTNFNSLYDRLFFNTISGTFKRDRRVLTTCLRPSTTQDVPRSKWRVFRALLSTRYRTRPSNNQRDGTTTQGSRQQHGCGIVVRQCLDIWFTMYWSKFGRPCYSEGSFVSQVVETSLPQLPAISPVDDNSIEQLCTSYVPHS